MLLDNSSSEDFFHRIKRQKDGSMIANIIGKSEAIEIYTPYDVTSSRPRKTKIAFFALYRLSKDNLEAKRFLRCTIAPSSCDLLTRPIRELPIKTGATGPTKLDLKVTPIFSGVA